MQPLENHHGSCPYCGEKISLLIDCSQVPQSYIEDCQVCCKPIVISVQFDLQQELKVELSDEGN
nr:CPXCG motif-containing cysteine-rich protein [Sinobacterium norvegicum]